MPIELAEISWRPCFASWSFTAQDRAFVAIITNSNRDLAVIAISVLAQLGRKSVVAIEVGAVVVTWPGQGC